MKKITDEMKNVIFWQPFIITYVITVVITIITAIIDYQIIGFVQAKPEPMFYQVVCPNYFIVAIMKIGEVLISTTITFGLTSVVATDVNKKSLAYIIYIVLLIVLGLVGVMFPIMNNMTFLWIYITFVYIIIIGFLIILKKLMCELPDYISAKTEESDGQF